MPSRSDEVGDSAADPQAAHDEFGIDDIAAQMIRRPEARLLGFARDALDAA